MSGLLPMPAAARLYFLVEKSMAAGKKRKNSPVFQCRKSDLAPELDRLTPNVTNLGLFQIRFQYIWTDPKLDKSGTFSDQISAHFGAGANMY